MSYPVYTTPSGQEIHLDQALGGGGEGEIWSISGRPEAAKIYHPAVRGREKERKLRMMLDNPPRDDMLGRYGHHSIAWPTDLILENKAFAGFLMPRLAKSHKILEIYNPRLRRTECVGFNWKYLMHTGYNLSVAMDAVHAKGYIIGDINEGNILVTSTALVSLIDTDSFQVRDIIDGKLYRCPVGKEDFTPPELQGLQFNQVDRLPEHDYFGLSVLIFLLLMEGNHPFAGEMKMDWPATEPSHIYCLKQGAFPYSSNSLVRRRPTAPAFRILPPPIQRLMVRAFVEGYSQPGQRPSAGEWAQALETAEGTLVQCQRQPEHYYSRHLGAACPWCQRGTLRPGASESQTGTRLQKPLPPTATTNPSGGKPQPAKTSSRANPPGRPTVGTPIPATRPSPTTRGTSLPGGSTPGGSRPRYSSLPSRVQAQINRAWSAPTYRRGYGYRSGLSRREWWQGMKRPVIIGALGGLGFAFLVLVLFNYPVQTSLGSGILVGLGVAAATFFLTRFFVVRLVRLRQRLGVPFVLAAVIGGSFLVYQAFLWGRSESLVLLHTYAPQWWGLLINGAAWGGVVGATLGNFRLLSRAYSRIVGILTSLAVVVPPLVLMALTGFFDLAFKILK